jgi:hypothetical protein
VAFVEMVACNSLLLFPFFSKAMCGGNDRSCVQPLCGHDIAKQQYTLDNSWMLYETRFGSQG